MPTPHPHPHPSPPPPPLALRAGRLTGPTLGRGPRRQDPRDDGRDSEFLFDRVLDAQATQEGVFKEACAPLVDKLFQGFNASILAYGQTGSRKTYR